MSFPFKAWQVKDAETAVSATAITFDYDGTGETPSRGTVSKTLTRTTWLPEYNEGTQVPAGTFIAVRYTPFDDMRGVVGTSEYYRVPLVGIYGASDALSVSFPRFRTSAVGLIVNFNELSTTGDIVTAYASTFDPFTGAILWGCSNQTAGSYADDPGLIYANIFNYTVNGKTRANPEPSPISVTNLALTTGERVATCDSTTGLEAGMWIKTSDAFQVASVVDGTTILLSRASSYTFTWGAVDAFGGTITDAGSGNVNIGVTFNFSSTTETASITFA